MPGKLNRSMNEALKRTGGRFVRATVGKVRHNSKVNSKPRKMRRRKNGLVRRMGKAVRRSGRELLDQIDR